MATEIVSAYPYWWRPSIEYTTLGDEEITRRLGRIEEQLSRIEDMIAKALGPPRE